MSTHILVTSVVPTGKGKDKRSTLWEATLPGDYPGMSAIPAEFRDRPAEGEGLREIWINDVCVAVNCPLVDDITTRNDAELRAAREAAIAAKVEAYAAELVAEAGLA
jgi:hypothetical protein